MPSQVVGSPIEAPAVVIRPVEALWIVTLPFWPSPSLSSRIVGFGEGACADQSALVVDVIALSCAPKTAVLT